jgi:hypothetical protein
MELLDLETWLNDQGADVVYRKAKGGALTDKEELLYECCLFDAEQQNGGVSQYFCNHGLAQWDSLCAAAIKTLPSFSVFAETVDAVVRQSSDPYLSILESPTNLDALYDQSKAQMIRDLRAVYLDK